MTSLSDGSKTEVHDFWEQASCGEEMLLASRDAAGYLGQMESRYRLEPFISQFAEFGRWKDKAVLEIGVGLGADHQSFAMAGARCTGIDLTERAIAHVARRFQVFGLNSELRVADAENLPFADESFDLVYSWGVIHHSPDTAKAAAEILRVLKPGGEFRVMIYHRHSIVGAMLWLRYALATGHPFMSLDEVYARHLESPGTKAYSRAGGQALFPGTRVSVTTTLTHGDLLSSGAGQRHRGIALSVAKALWPRRLIKALLPGAGLFMLISGRKS